MVSASTAGIPTKLFKLARWPDFPGVVGSESFESLMKDTHEYMAYVVIVLPVTHIGAALKHHLVNKDDVVMRMIPVLKLKD